MEMVNWGLLAVIGVAGYILNDAINNVRRQCNEAIANHHHAISRIPALESEVKTLRKTIRGLERQIDKLTPPVTDEAGHEDDFI